MAIQTKLGKAFEYACIQSLYSELKDHQEVTIVDSNALTNAKDSYNSGLDIETKRKLIEGANAAIRVILKLEPQLGDSSNNVPLHLAINDDSAGIAGDVRDVLCIRKQNKWEIGFSCKHNHAAVKHSRLSIKINFGEQWFGRSCTQEYFSTIRPLFNELSKLKSNKVLWSDIKDKEKRFYIPLLQAFMDELNRLDVLYTNYIPQKLLCYLLGRNDFYKIITNDAKRVTQVQCFNIYGSLNKSAGNIKSITNIPQLIMPTRFFNIGFKPGSGNTILVVCDNGWTISMRIHNARSLVEPSLKFDVRLVGIPTNLYTQFEPW